MGLSSPIVQKRTFCGFCLGIWMPLIFWISLWRWILLCGFAVPVPLYFLCSNWVLQHIFGLVLQGCVFGCAFSSTENCRAHYSPCISWHWIGHLSGSFLLALPVWLDSGDAEPPCMNFRHFGDIWHSPAEQWWASFWLIIPFAHFGA